MPEPASEDYVPVPRRIKISSKRQITIPVDVYERQGFAEHAVLTETEDGFTVQPFQVADDDEELTVGLLRYLMDKGYEGEALLDKFVELKPSFFDYYSAIRSSEADIAAGRVSSYGEMRERIRSSYGI